jgi:predicted dehydrogenase
VHARRVGPFPERVRDVGVVLDLAPHDIDVMVHPRQRDRARTGGDRAAHQYRIRTCCRPLRFANGVVGVLDINWLTPAKIRELSVLGERGMFVVDYLARTLTSSRTPTRTGRAPIGRAPPEGERGAGAPLVENGAAAR